MKVSIISDRQLLTSKTVNIDTGFFITENTDSADLSEISEVWDNAIDTEPLSAYHTANKIATNNPLFAKLFDKAVDQYLKFNPTPSGADLDREAQMFMETYDDRLSVAKIAVGSLRSPRKNFKPQNKIKQMLPAFFFLSLCLTATVIYNYKPVEADVIITPYREAEIRYNT